jgi:hypothetical protein
MANEKIYRCPTCNKELTKEEYDKALQIDRAREKEINNRIKEAFDAGAKQYEQQINLLTKQNAKLQDTIEHLEKGDTAQRAGFENEMILQEGLKKEFPSDDVERHGHHGDVLQVVNYDSRSVGLIVFECKRKTTLDTKDIRQAYAALQYRKADYAILVTTATRTDKHKHAPFDSLLKEKDVLIIRPAGVLSLVSLLRDSLIFMYKSNLSPEQRLDANRKLSDYLAQGEGGLAIKTIVHHSSQLYDRLIDEIRRHKIDWNEQWKDICHINIAGNILSQNIGLILSGQKPIILNSQKPLALPRPKETLIEKEEEQ